MIRIILIPPIQHTCSLQEENAIIGKSLLSFYSDTVFLLTMNRNNLGEKKYHNYLAQFCYYADLMKNKKNYLRRDGYNKIVNTYTMLGKNNIPAANWSAKSAIEKMKKRWFINKKIINNAQIRIRYLNKLKTI
jgi:hypothetical protein